MRILYF